MSSARVSGCRGSDSLYNGTNVFLFNATEVPLLVVGVALLCLTLLAGSVGVRVGRKLQAQLSDTERFQLFGVQASLLGLLALLLGFSFAMGQTRYDVRRRTVVDEANAIGTSRLRAEAVPDPVGSEIQALLRDLRRATAAWPSVHLLAPMPEPAH